LDAPVRIRPIEGRDAGAVTALLDATTGHTSLRDRAREVTNLALGSGDREHRAFVADDGRELCGIVVYGELLGSDRVMRVHFLGFSRSAEGQRLLDAVNDAARESRARFVFIEIADDPALRDTLRVLEDAGYRQEARIADYVRDGVALLFLRRSI
jgi:hypothetical protein